MRLSDLCPLVPHCKRKRLPPHKEEADARRESCRANGELDVRISTWDGLRRWSLKQCCIEISSPMSVQCFDGVAQKEANDS